MHWKMGVRYFQMQCPVGSVQTICWSYSERCLSAIVEMENNFQILKREVFAVADQKVKVTHTIWPIFER